MLVNRNATSAQSKHGWIPRMYYLRVVEENLIPHYLCSDQGSSSSGPNAGGGTASLPLKSFYSSGSSPGTRRWYGINSGENSLVYYKNYDLKPQPIPLPPLQFFSCFLERSSSPSIAECGLVGHKSWKYLCLILRVRVEMLSLPRRQSRHLSR